MKKLGILSFFKDIFNFLSAGSVLGIDIGTASIKVVEISRKGERFQLVNYGMLETQDYLLHANLALQTSSLSIVENEASRLLQYLVAEMKTKTTTALVSIPSFASFITLLDIPLLSEKETSQSIMFQARKYIPMPIEQVSVDWLKVDEYTNERGHRYQRLLLIGIPQKIITSYKNICKAAGLKTVALEIDGIALARTFSSFTVPTLLVDIGAESTNMVVVEGGMAKHTSQTDYSGIHVTRALSKSLDLNMKRADVLKKRHGLLGRAGESELSTLILPFLDVIIQEVSYAKSLYERRYGKKVEQFTLIGGGAKLLGIEQHFSGQLGIQHIPPDTFSDIDYMPEIEPALQGLTRDLPVAVGLTKRYFIS